MKNFNLSVIILVYLFSVMVIGQQTTGSNWMAQQYDNIKDKPLNEVIMPSAHDAGTFGIHKNSPVCEHEIGLSSIAAMIEEVLLDDRELAAKFSKAQELDIKSQLELGIRGLDLRYCYYKENDQVKYYPSHTLINLKQDSIEQLKDIIEFLKSNKKELVVIKLKLFDLEGKKLTKFFDKHFFNHKDLLATTKLKPTSSFSEFVESNQRLVVIADLGNRQVPKKWQEYFWVRNNSVRSFWPNEKSLKKLLSIMKREMSLKKPKKTDSKTLADMNLKTKIKKLWDKGYGGLAFARSHDALHIAQFIITAQKSIQNIITRTSLLEASERINEKLLQAAKQALKGEDDPFNLKKANLIHFDNVGYEKGNLVRAIYMLNDN